MFVFCNSFLFRVVYSDPILIPSEQKLLGGFFSVGKSVILITIRSSSCTCVQLFSSFFFRKINNSLFFKGLATKRRSTNGVRERREYHGTPSNKLVATEVEDRARLVVEASQVMRSHYCRTNSRRLYLPAGTGIADLYREFKRAFNENTKIPSHTWFYQFMGTNYNIGTHKPKNDR